MHPNSRSLGDGAGGGGAVGGGGLLGQLKRVAIMLAMACLVALIAM